MAITLGNAGANLLGRAIDSLEENIFNDDPALKTSLPAEAGIRNALSFASMRIQFPTRAGRLPYANYLTTNGLTFPAYITSLSDKFTPSVTGQQAYGRTDPAPVFKNVTRSISVTLTIPCFDAKDASENMKKVNEFIKNLYPTYNSYKGDLVIGSPPLVRVRFANLITNTISPYSGLLGYITSFDYSFETGDGFYFSDQQNLFFRAYKLTFTFSVLHEGVVGAINGRFFNFKQDFPYRADEEFGTINTTADGTPINRDVAEANILGSG